MIEGYPEDEIETGARLAYSALTDTTYLVTRWVEQDDGDIVSLSKQEAIGIRECAECGATGDPDEEYGVEGFAQMLGNICVECAREKIEEGA